MKNLRFSALLIALIFLPGCGTDLEDDLKKWMAGSSAQQTHAEPEPAPPPVESSGYKFIREGPSVSEIGSGYIKGDKSREVYSEWQKTVTNLKDCQSYFDCDEYEARMKK